MIYAELAVGASPTLITWTAHPKDWALNCDVERIGRCGIEMEDIDYINV